MRWTIALSFATLGCCVGWLPTPAAAEPQLADVRAIVAEWVQTRKTIARTRAEWASDKAAIEQQIALLTRELDRVREQLSHVDTNQAAVAAQHASLTSTKGLYQAGLEAVQKRLGEFERRILQLEPLFPPSLQATLRPLLNKLPSGSAPENVQTVTRLLTIVTLLNEIDKFNSTLSVVEETRTLPDGTRAAVQVIYAGLGQAWFVNKSGDFAGYGVPKSSGWQWTVNNEFGPDVARAIRIYRNEMPAEFVNLPVSIQ